MWVNLFVFSFVFCLFIFPFILSIVSYFNLWKDLIPKEWEEHFRYENFLHMIEDFNEVVSKENKTCLIHPWINFDQIQDTSLPRFTNLYNMSKQSLVIYNQIFDHHLEIDWEIQSENSQLTIARYAFQSPKHNKCSMLQSAIIPIQSSLSIDELTSFLFQSIEQNLLLDIPKAYTRKFSPILSFEWYNGSIEVFHFPILTANSWQRREFVGLKIVEKYAHRLILQSISPDYVDIDLIISQARSFGYSSPNLKTKLSNPYIFSIALSLEPGPTTGSFHLRLIRLLDESDQQSFVANYATNRIYFQRVTKTLHTLLSNSNHSLSQTSNIYSQNEKESL